MASSIFFHSKSVQVSGRLLKSVVLAGLLLCSAACQQKSESIPWAIKVDQVGYPVNGPKVAIASAPGTSFEILRSTDYMAMRGFYGQRCGTAVDMGPEFPGFKHPACHLERRVPDLGQNRPRDNIGGWHDAGDYGRYVVNSGITTGTLLWTWEMFGAPDQEDRVKLISGVGNGTPDILNEIRWNLEWMLKMQDEDGGVWHKQTSEHFSGFISPEDDKLPSEVIGTGAAPYKSTCATGDLAVVGAIAARVYQPFDGPGRKCQIGPKSNR
jgi:hypothetical protein